MTDDQRLAEVTAASRLIVEALIPVSPAARFYGLLEVLELMIHRGDIPPPLSDIVSAFLDRVRDTNPNELRGN